MNFNEYQKQAITTDVFSESTADLQDFSFLEKAFGLLEESGEVAGKLKRLYREKDGQISPDDKAEIIKEFGDILWYLSALSHYLGVPLEEVAQTNLQKVLSRKARGQTLGQGDNR